jgi:hypothetical protein
MGVEILEELAASIFSEKMEAAGSTDTLTSSHVTKHCLTQHNHNWNGQGCENWRTYFK